MVIVDSGKDMLMFGVDSDFVVVDFSVVDIMLVLIMKVIDVVVKDVIVVVVKGEFDLEFYVGMFENEGVKFFGFGDFEL